MEITTELQDSLTLKFSQTAREMNQKGTRIFSLGLGEPAFSTPEPILEATVKAMKDGHTKYSHHLGLPELRKAIAAKLERDNGIKVKDCNIVVTPGAKQAIQLALMAILRPGDEIINFSPSFVSFLPQIKIAEPKAVIKNVGFDKATHAINWDAVQKAVSPKTKAILINFPHNPTGKMLTRAEVDKLAELVELHGFYVISDEVYERLSFSGHKVYSPAAIERIANKVVTINGFSKSFGMTGWRIGYLAGPNEVIDIVSKLQQHINTNTCTFVQKGACAAFSVSDEYLKKYNAELKEKADFLVDTLRNHPLLSVVSPEGGLFGFVDVSKTGLNSDAFATKLLTERQVACTPGVAFGADWDDHVRVSLATETQEFKEAIRRTAGLFK